MVDVNSPADGAYQVSIGEATCTVLVDGSFEYPNPTELLFATAPPPARDGALREYGLDPDGWETATLPYLCLLVEVEGRTVLVDTGAGDTAPTTGNLLDVLAAVGVEPGDIDDVVVTHGHPDHVGGLAADGEPVFGAADHHITAAEYDYWLPEPDLSGVGLPEEFTEMMRTTAAANLKPLADRFTRHEGEATVAPGVRLVPAPGHTPGHAAVVVESAGDRLLHLVDTVVHPLHVEHPDWGVGFDHDPEQVGPTRRELLGRAADADCSLVTHFQEPGLGGVRETEDGFVWEPVGTAD